MIANGVSAARPSASLPGGELTDDGSTSGRIGSRPSPPSATSRCVRSEAADLVRLA